LLFNLLPAGVQSLYGLHDAVHKGTALHLFFKSGQVVLVKSTK